MPSKLISISIVIHNQAEIARQLFEDISAIDDPLAAEILLTINTHERIPYKISKFRHSFKIIRNTAPKGFGANHNAAFRLSKGRYFCVLNPDIRLIGNPFNTLIECLEKRGGGLVAPRIVNLSGTTENNARYFPTPFTILKKAFLRSQQPDYPEMERVFEPDWVGGMFMLFTRSCFEAINGFDERYFLYYEDVDLCARMKMAHLPILLCPFVKAVHDARFESHHSLKYLRWHVASMARFFLSKGFWQLAASPRMKT